MHIVCSDCQTEYPLDTRLWKCARCGGLFEIADAPRFDPARIDRNERSLWRYRAFLPLPPDAAPVTLGEGWTPLVDFEHAGVRALGKLDFINPTGSFKDRGASVQISLLRMFGVTRIVEDSSGNAAAAISAYAARAKIHADIFVPAHASPAKIAQIEVYGARVHRIEGPRENCALAAQEIATRGEAYYASHYYSPLGLAGLRTAAYEIWEQLDGRAPDNVVVPTAHGTNVIGIYRGFQEIRAAGLIEKMPRLFAIQAANVAPLALAFALGLADAPASEPKPTVAEGIAIAKPVRGREILRGVKETGGAVIAVGEDEILQARNDLARQGFYIEPTSASAAAALKQVRERIGADDVTVVSLTGSGLKSG
jgi:threonine synthase